LTLFFPWFSSPVSGFSTFIIKNEHLFYIKNWLIFWDIFLNFPIINWVFNWVFNLFFFKPIYSLLSPLAKIHYFDKILARIFDLCSLNLSANFWTNQIGRNLQRTWNRPKIWRARFRPSIFNPFRDYIELRRLEIGITRFIFSRSCLGLPNCIERCRNSRNSKSVGRIRIYRQRQSWKLFSGLNNVIITKYDIMVKNRNVGQKFKFWWKVEILSKFVQSRYFLLKIEMCSKFDSFC